MGGCCSVDDNVSSNYRVNKELQHSKAHDKQIKKLLLLGAGSSGKTTFFKQLKRIHGEGFTSKDRIDYRAQIYSQVIEQMQKLILRSIELIDEYPNEYKHLQTQSEQTKKSAQFIEYISRETEINEEIAKNINILWQDSGIRATFDMRAKLAIPDSCSHFFDSISRISANDYLPTDQDILLVRKRTTGIIEEEFMIQETKFHIFDVGGQRNERKKWIHCFENVTAVIFVASLSAYNEVLLEDESVNVIDETLNLFEEICNSQWFTQTPFILFLNKSDLFYMKLQHIPLQEGFPDYRGDSAYDNAVEYIQSAFEKKNHNSNKQLFVHVTCATDRNNVKKVFNDVQHIVINYSLHKGGLI